MNPTATPDPNPATPALTMPAATRASIRHTLSLYGPAEARYALLMLEAGRVDGRTWNDLSRQCGCLLGTLEMANEPDVKVWSWTLEGRHGVSAMEATKPAQDWFGHIFPGDTPSTDPYAKLAAEAISEWLREQVHDLAPLNPLLAPESTRHAIAHLLKEA